MEFVLPPSDVWLSRLIYLLFVLLHIGFVIRVILRPHRQPASRIAWIAVMTTLPLVGILIYILVGETNIGRKKAERARKIAESLPALTTNPASKSLLEARVPVPYHQLFRTASSISGFETVAGNSARLYSCSNQTIGAMVTDIDAASESVHVLFYIWLTDHNGSLMAEALIRAAQRGIQCRVMADDLGSRDFIRSQLWRDMESAGVQITAALPIGSILMRILKGRIDLRNHRKIVVIDNQITYCGSQNCADAEFRVKPKYAPWVDAVLRLEGPIASQQQRIFISDWLTKKDEDLSELLARPLKAKNPGFPAQAFGTGPTIRYSAMPEMFDSLLFLAQKEVLITTPYYVPDESLQSAICTAALRGIEVTMILPAKNDSFVVGAASHSYYESLLKAGVKIFEFEGGLLHTKSLTVDGVVTLIGSANMDRRSFDLNYENNIILYDAPLTTEVRELQNQYMAQSRQVSLDHVLAWPRRRRLWNNTIAMLGPIL